MRPEDIKKFRDQEPFVPFRIVFTDGRAIEIPHRDFLFVAQHTIEIGIDPDPTTAIPAETILASPLHVVRIESIQQLTA